MISDIVKSAQGLGNLCRILNRHGNPARSTGNFIHGSSAGKCPHCGVEMVKHIFEEGSRCHVHSYHGYTDKSRSPVKCSDPRCVDNHGIGKCVNLDGKSYGDLK